ncbi:MAG: YraN family protein [Steroidobacteraceae bacterium]
MGAHQRGNVTPTRPASLTARRARERLHRGQLAELAAARFLESRHCTVLLRNYRCRMGEIDIVAREADGTLLIAEVRLRSRCDFGTPAESVTASKQARILRASRHLLAVRPAFARCAIRFDVIEVQPAAEESAYRLHWIRHAFECR